MRDETLQPGERVAENGGAVQKAHRRIVIVGNGEVDATLGAEIDSADQVIRFNFCRSFGAGGKRTDVIAVCNTGRPGKAMLGDPEWRSHPAVEAAGEILCVRDPAKFAAMRPALVRAHPELDDFCDDYTEGFEQLARENGKGFRIIDPAVHEDLDRQLRPIAADYVVPSSGLIVIADVMARLRADDRILLAGFSHEGWEWHPFAAERTLVNRWTGTGKLLRIEPGRPGEKR